MTFADMGMFLESISRLLQTQGRAERSTSSPTSGTPFARTSVQELFSTTASSYVSAIEPEQDFAESDRSVNVWDVNEYSAQLIDHL